MKKTFILKALILFLGASFIVSCSKDDNQNKPTPIKPNGLIIEATIDEGATVKSGVVEDNDDYTSEKFKWITDDEIFIAVNEINTKGKFKATNITGNKADFTNVESLSILPGQYKLIALSPYENIPTLEGVNVSIPQEQTQNGNTSNHIGAYDYMWAKKDNVTINNDAVLDNAGLNFKHINPLLRFSIKNISGTNLSLKKIEISTSASNSQFYKDGIFNISLGVLTLNLYAPYSTRVLNFNGTSTLNSGTDILTADVFNAYMMLFPTTGYNSGEKFFITLTLNNGTNDYTKTIELLSDDYPFLLDGGGFQAGHSYYFKIAIADDGMGAVIPAGSFYMGSPEEEDDRYANEEQYLVTLSKGFRMTQYQVTNAQFANFLNAMKVGSAGIKDGETLIQNSGHSLVYSSIEQKWQPAESDKGNYPVRYVSWHGANAYAKWVGGSLPTEAQWEYACRADASATPLTTPFNTGSTLSNATFNASTTTEVGTYARNAWDLYDMHGNVAEWCSNWYYDYTGPETDPKGPITGTERVARGGAYDSNAQFCRSAFRIRINGGQQQITTGFRVVFND